MSLPLATGASLTHSLERMLRRRFECSEARAYLKFSEGGIVQRILHRIKYGGGKELAFQLGRQFALSEKREERLSSAARVIVPVPLHPKKLVARGFNQSEQIARGLADITGWDLDLELLYRAQEAGSQTKLDSLGRTKNAADQYACSNKARPDVQYVLVDDMITTGATLEACVSALRTAGAADIGIRGLACDLDI